MKCVFYQNSREMIVNMKQIEIKIPKYENVKVGDIVQIKWETSDGKQFDNKLEADTHEFYYCKVNQRGHNLPVMRVEIFDFSSIEDIERYEYDYVDRDYVKKYDKTKMIFPNTYVMYHEYDPDFEYHDLDEYGYGQPDTHVYFVTLEEYKKLLLDAINDLK
jgi:hypothetical protein